MSNDGWNKVGGSGQKSETWKPVKEGDEVTGRYVDVRDVTTNFGAAKVYVLQQPDGSEVSVFGKPNLNRHMERVNLQEEVRIVYMGLEKNPKTGFSFKKFEVYNRKPVATADLKGKAAEKAEEVNPSDIPF